MTNSQAAEILVPSAPHEDGYLLSLIIPCYNESSRIDTMLQGLAEFEENWKGAYELIIVDDGSKDDTANKVKTAIETAYTFLKDKTRIEVITPNQGKGNALKAGVAVASGKYILTLDADMSTRPIELINWQNRDPNVLVAEDTIYIASRKHPDGKLDALQSRKIIGGIFNGLVQVFTSLPHKDTQCGFKLYPREVAKFLFGDLKSKGWTHDVELLYQASLNDIKIVDMPVNWVTQPESKVHLVKDSVTMFFGLISIVLRIWFYNNFVLPFKIPAHYTPEQKKRIQSRAIFNTIALLLVIVMPIMSFQYGVTGDEHHHYDYGNNIYNYFFHHDKTASLPAEDGIQFYGGIFDFITAWVYHTFHFWDHYTTMHFCNAIVGAIGIIYAGKLGKLLGGWNVGILAMVLLVLSPSWFGHNFANPKDIPFSVGYTAGIYFMLLFLKALPYPNTRHIAGLVCSIGWAMGVRIGGLLLIAYLVLFIIVYALFTKQLKTVINFRILKKVLVVAILGYIIALICWPYAHTGFITKPMESLKVMSNFFVNISILYEGKKILSNQIPWYYIPKYILFTAPVIILLGMAIGFISLPLVFWKKKENLLFSYFVLFAALFPIGYAVYKDSSLYDGWRHFLFIYPMLIVIASIGFMALINSRQKVIKYATIGLIVVGLVSPVKFAVANHTFESLYYNEIAGGLKGIYGKYETDYYMLGVKPAMEWLLKNEGLDHMTAIIGTTCTYPVLAYAKPYKNLTTVYVRYYERYSRDWDYCIVYSRFVDASQILEGDWPSSDVIHVISVDGVPIAAILKRKTHLDAKGFDLLKDKKSEEAKQAFLASLREYPDNELVWEALARIYYMADQDDSAIYCGYRTLSTYPADITAYEIIGKTYLLARHADSAIALYTYLNRYDPGSSHYLLAFSYAAMGHIRQAYIELDEGIEVDPYNEQLYRFGMDIAQKTKDPGKEEEYYERAKKVFNIADDETPPADNGGGNGEGGGGGGGAGIGDSVNK